VAIGATAAGEAAHQPTMSEWHVAALVMAAVWLVLAAQDRPERRLALLAMAGLCGGAAAGFKLTGAPYAAGLAAMVVAFPGAARQRLARLTVLGLGGLAGFLAVYGPWGWDLYQRTQNPFFPFLNDVFRSPLWFARPYREEPFAAKTLLDAVSLPLRLARDNASVVSELPLRDARLALAFPALAFLAFRRRRADAPERMRWRATSRVRAYASWVSSSGHQFARVSALSAAAIGAAVAALAPDRGGLRFAAPVVVAVLLVAGTRCPDWGRVPHGAPAVTARIPGIPADAMVVIATLEPVAYVVPSLPPEVPVVAGEPSPRGHPSRLEDRAASARSRDRHARRGGDQQASLLSGNRSSECSRRWGSFQTGAVPSARGSTRTAWRCAAGGLARSAR
jgi:hypothetical protein